MSRRVKIPLIILAVIIGLMLLSMLIVPWQVKKQSSAWIAENTNRTLAIEKAFFNPFALSLELENLKLSEQQSEQSFVTFKRLLVSVSARSILDRALILDRLELDDPFVNIELLGKQEFNFSDFTRLGGDSPDPEPAEQEESDPFLFSLNNIIINNGSIDFTDQTSKLKSKHEIRQLQLGVPFIGNIPYLTDEYVNPGLSLLLNNSPITVDGHLKPFHDSMETELNLKLDQLDLAFYAYHSPLPLPVEVDKGMLDLAVDLAYHVSANQEPKLMLGGQLKLSAIEVSELSGKPLLKIPQLSVELDWADLFKQDINLASIAINKPEFYLDRDSGGRWNFDRIMPSKNAESNPESATEENIEDTAATNALPLLTAQSITLNDGRFHFSDEFVAGGFKEQLSGINLRLGNLSTHADQLTTASLSFSGSRGLDFKVSGDVSLNPVKAALELRTEQLLLEPLYPYMEPFITAPLQGTINLASRINYLEDGNITLEQTGLNLRDLKVPFDQKDAFTLKEFSITGTSVDVEQQQVNIGPVNLKQGAINLRRLSDGSFSPLQLLKEQPQEETPVATEESAPWKIIVSSLDLEQFKLTYRDLLLDKKPQVVIPRIDFHAEKLSWPEAQNSPFTLQTQIGKKGRINLSGSVFHTPLKLKVKSSIKDFPLADFNDFIPADINLHLKEGYFFNEMDLALAQKGDVLSGEFSGRSDITRFNLRDPFGDGELLGWESLNVRGLKGTIEPLSLSIEEVALSNYLANILINRDGAINLTSITSSAEADQEEDKAAAAPKEEPAATEESERTEASATPPVRIDAITLQGGTVSFVDRSMSNTFSATMYELGGRITGMDSIEIMNTDVDLRGELENHSPLTINGQLNPLAEDLFADLTISFKDIDLTPMSPYSGTYIGQMISKGKLNLDLGYHIEDRKIDADNKIMIDQFTLGDKVESDKAVSLPVGLAIALLKDTNDEIHLNVPVHGDLDDPSFSVAGVVFTVIKNLIVKAATSPFSLLAAVAGGGDQDFTSVTFASGLATIDEQQLSNLQQLAGMLAKRPSLTLEISAFADAELDPESYRQEQLRRKLAAVKERELKEEGAPIDLSQPLSWTEEEYPELLLSVYEEAEFPRPRNFIGMLKELPQEEMEKLLLANILAGEEQMVELAKQRALVVRDALVAADESIKDRLFLIKQDIYTAAKDGPNTRVEFNISAK